MKILLQTLRFVMPFQQGRRRFMAALAALPFVVGAISSGTVVRSGWVLRAEDR